MLLNEGRLNELMAREGIDAIVATAPENVTYTSGFWAMTQWIRRGPQAYVLWPASDRGEPTIITATSTLDLVADQDIWIRDVHRFGYFEVSHNPDGTLGPLDQRQAELYGLPDSGDALDALCAAIRERGLERATLGIDELGLLPGHFDRLRERLPDARLKPALELLRQTRAIKTKVEVARLRRAAEITERSIEAALAVATETATELDLARAFHERTVREDAMPVLGCIGTGPRSAMPNAQPSSRQLEPGDVIRFDVGGRYQHYRADIARIGVLGEPSKRISTYYKALHAGVRRAYDVIRPGISASDVFHAVMETVQREGLSHYRRNHVGHGIGLDGYDPPNLSPTSRDVIEEGMVLCVETPYYELGSWGLQVEDMLVVRRDGVESLMTTDGSLMVV